MPENNARKKPKTKRAKGKTKLLRAADDAILKLAQSPRPPKWVIEELRKKGGHNVERERKELVSSKVRLSESLGITRPTLDRVMGVAGNPGRMANGNYDVAKWRDFINTPGVLKPDWRSGHNKIVPANGKFQQSEGEEGLEEEDTPASLRLRRERFELEKAEWEWKNYTGEFAPKSEIEEAIARANQKFQQELKRVFVINLPSEYQAAGGDEVECRKLNENALREVLENLATKPW